MAELTTPAETTTNARCAPAQQATGREAGDVREQVRERYAAAAAQVTSTDP